MGLISKLSNALGTFGVHPQKLVQSLCGMPRYFGDIRRYKKLATNNDMPLHLRNLKPILFDFYAAAGEASGHYFYQDMWAARKIFRVRPSRHVDIGSRIDGFIAHLLTFMEVEVIDIRPLTSQVDGLSFVQSDATHLKNIPDDSIESLSCLHAIEHFGLGRYTDPVDPSACYAAMSSMARVLKPGGRLYLGTPVGIPRLEFNSQRVFSPVSIVSHFNSLKLLSFACINDDGNFVAKSEPVELEKAKYSCGLFEFTK